MGAMHELQASGFAEFDRLNALFLRTRQLLDVACATGELPDAATEVLATETLPHVEDIEEGFRVWLRAGSVELSAMRAFVTRAGVSADGQLSNAERRAALIEAMHEIARSSAQHPLVPAPRRAMAALEHARLVFAMLPATATEDVHFPQGRRTYADILPPRGAAELAERIEELERSLWAVATRRAPRVADGSYRRTYGFFDTAARISGSHFLIS
jgi:hypothetical protein